MRWKRIWNVRNEVLCWTNFSIFEYDDLSYFRCFDIIMSTILTITDMVASIIPHIKQYILIVTMFQTAVCAMKTHMECKKWSSMLDQLFYFRIWWLVILSMLISSWIQYWQSRIWSHWLTMFDTTVYASKTHMLMEFYAEQNFLKYS